MAKIVLWTSLLILISVTSSSPVTTTASGRCPDEWVVFGNSCYKLITEKLSWQVAKDTCGDVGSTLVNIGSEREDQFVFRLAQNHGVNVWIGLTDAVQEGHFLWTDTQDEPIYINWHFGEPDDRGRKQNCAIVFHHTKGGWYDDNCEMVYSTVCERPSSSDNKTTASGRCPDTWVVFGKSCYKLIPQESTWYEARAICKSIGSSLVNIGSKKEDQFVVRLAQNHGVNVWINLMDVVQEGHFLWTDTQQEPTYTNWGSGEPNNSQNMQDCVTVSSGFWNDYHCLEKYAAICEKVSSD